MHLKNIIAEGEMLDQEVYARRWQAKVNQYLERIEALDVLHKFKLIQSDNIFDDVSSQLGILTALDHSYSQEVMTSGAESVGLNYPSKVTLRWLYENMPIKIWGLLISLLVVFFVLGLKLGEYEVFTKIWNKLFQ